MKISKGILRRRNQGGFLGLLGVFSGIGGTIAGAVSSRRTRQTNEARAEQARQDEIERRERAAREAERLIDEYNELRDERPGLTIEDFLGDFVRASGNEEAREAFSTATQEDFNDAQLLADQASQNNVRTFNVVLDAISGGDSLEILKQRNEIALGTNEIDAFNRALQLRSPAIPAGTVKLNREGRLVEGQRADRQVFQTAFEISEAQRDKRFDRLSSVLASDRAVADRQQEKAKDFLDKTDFTSLARDFTAASRSAQTLFQQLDETRQFNLIRDFTNAAFTNQTAQPTFQNTDTADTLTASGINLGLRGLAQLTAKEKPKSRDKTSII